MPAEKLPSTEAAAPLPAPPDQDGGLPRNTAELDRLLSCPTDAVREAVRTVSGDGDFIVLGVGGKMGPTLARMIRSAVQDCAPQHGPTVYGAARFTQSDLPEALSAEGIAPIACDLLDREAVRGLPDAASVFFLAGQKFGATQEPERTWAMNTLVPAFVAERYAGSRLVVFSTGCVYSNTPIGQGGSRESDPLEPPGEYANSCVGRERIFQHYSRRNGTRVSLFRLNYSNDLRYGVLLDVAQKVRTGEPIDLGMGHVNLIWQRDATAWAIQCLPLASAPPFVLNAAGPETVSIRGLACRFGELLGRAPIFTGAESETALLSNAGKAHALFGYPGFALERMIDWTAEWLRRDGRTLGKPTHYEVRDGRY